MWERFEMRNGNKGIVHLVRFVPFSMDPGLQGAAGVQGGGAADFVLFGCHAHVGKSSTKP